MAEYKFALALNAAEFPQLSRLQQRPAIIPGLDNKLKNPATTTTSNADNNSQNTPQIIYAENVLPIPEGGIMSVGYTSIQSAGAQPYFDDLYILRDADENEWYYSPAAGYNYVVSAFGDPWVSKSPLGSAPVSSTTRRFSIAYVNGATYICYAGLYIGHWDGATENFVDDIANLTGVVISNILCIAGAGNYLILFCYDNSVKWSSLLNALDFVPSELTGAGSQIPLDIRGQVLAGTPMSGGFLVHCRHNTVAALYTNNAAQPWIFREVKNGGGFLNKSYFSKDSSQGTLFAYTTYGLQTLNLREAESIHPTVNDFLGGRAYETFSPVTKLITLTNATNNFKIKVASILNRYLTLSYGLQADSFYFAALVYDMVTKRWGKFNRNHVDIFSVKAGVLQDNVMMLGSTGTVEQVLINYSNQPSDAGVLILGRYQINRSHQICSQEVEVETLRSTESFTLNVVTNYNGTTVGQVVPMALYDSTDNYRKYQAQIEGENISYVLEGAFTLATMLATVTLGSRM